MEMMMNVMDGVFSIVELVEEIKAFFQREDVRRVMVQGRQIGQAMALVVALVAAVLLWFVLCGVKAVYRAWVAALPVAIQAFQEGYAGVQSVPNAPLLLPATVEANVVMVEVPTQPLSQQLRQQCQSAGVQWRNANGQNKHLTVKQMQAALAQASSQDFANV
jgi:hypothetical protein